MARHLLSIAAAVAGLTLTGPAVAAGLHDVPAPSDAPETLTAIIEIPAGTDVKYEIDADGRIFVDRFMALPVVYPANYGSIAGTRAEDGDPLDILVFSRRAIAPGALIRVRPIGVLRMKDGPDTDDKVIAVPVSKVDKSYEPVKSVADLPPGDRDRLLAFFRIYKQDASGKTPIMLSGFGDADEAKALLRGGFKPAAGK